MQKKLFRTKNIGVYYDAKTTEVSIYFRNIRPSDRMAKVVLSWYAGDERVIASILTRAQILKICALVKTYFEIDVFPKYVFEEHEFDELVFIKNKLALYDKLSARQLCQLASLFTRSLPNENISKHIDNVLGNIASQIGQYNDVDDYVDSVFPAAESYVDYVRSFR